MHELFLPLKIMQVLYVEPRRLAHSLIQAKFATKEAKHLSGNLLLFLVCCRKFCGLIMSNFALDFQLIKKRNDGKHTYQFPDV